MVTLTMVVFLAGQDTIQTRELHTRIKNRFQSATEFGTVQLRVTPPREPWPYRVAAQTSSQGFPDDDSYPETTAQIEVGFELAGQTGDDHYWFNWIEPDRRFLLGWHQDADHPDLGPVHMQVNQNETTIERESATCIDNHPTAVLEGRLDQLPAALESVQWDGDTLRGIHWQSSADRR